MATMLEDVIPAAEMKKIFPGTSDQYWATLRHKGGGPEYLKVGPRKVFYRRAAVEAWLAGNRFVRTDQRLDPSPTIAAVAP